MAEYKSKGISIKYRHCNIPEKLELFQAIGMTPGSTDVNNDYSMFAKGINYIGFLIEEVSVKHEGEIINSWEDLLQEEEMTSVVVSIFSDIMNPPKKRKVKKQ